MPNEYVSLRFFHGTVFDVPRTTFVKLTLEKVEHRRIPGLADTYYISRDAKLFHFVVDYFAYAQLICIPDIQPCVIKELKMYSKCDCKWTNRADVPYKLHQKHEDLCPENSEIQDSIQMCLEAVSHALECPDANCRLMSCHRMKKIILHIRECEMPDSDCIICERFQSLAVHHAKTCRVDNCPMPYCNYIRVRYRQLAMN